MFERVLFFLACCPALPRFAAPIIATMILACPLLFLMEISGFAEATPQRLSIDGYHWGPPAIARISFDCAKAVSGADHIICADDNLLLLQVELDEAYKGSLAKGGDALRADQRAWAQKYGPECGLPGRGTPPLAVALKGRDCLAKSLNSRIAYLRAIAGEIRQRGVERIPSPSGAYQYVRKGHSGKMVVSEISACTIKSELGCLGRKILKISVNTINDATYSDCDLSAIENSSARVAEETRIETTFSTVAEANEKPKIFDIVFERDRASVSSLADLDLVGLCGMGADFLGNWRKVGGSNIGR